jgi:3-oxoacyl-[acyl-carrier protein] reductase
MSDKRRVLVTGGSRGIGSAIAIRLAGEGFDVAFNYRTPSPAAEATAEAVRRQGAQCYHAACDVADAESAKAFIKAAEEEIGQIDTLVNSAGIVRDNPMVLMSAEDWNSVIDTNLTGTFNFCQALVFGLMKRKSGTIVNLSSVAGVYGNKSQTNYSAAKAGINGMSKALAKEVASYGIRVNVVAPGFIETDMTAALTGKTRDKALGLVPMKRFGQAADVADLVSFLVSDKAAYITGQVIQVDGGITI